MAYGGTWWLARQAGVDARRAHLPALVVVTSAYAVSNIYARGAWPEFMATSSIPLAVAAGVALLRARDVRATSWAALLGSLVILAGSHNLTLLWSALLGGIFVIVWVSVGGRLQGRREAAVWR